MGHGFVVSAVAGVLTGVSGGILRDIYVMMCLWFSVVSYMLQFLLLL
jgi:uncharacterized membrane protein YeiH